MWHTSILKAKCPNSRRQLSLLYGFCFSYNVIVVSDIERAHCVTVEVICRKLFHSGNVLQEAHSLTCI